MNLKKQILAAFAAAKNEHERGLVLSEVASARHEIRVEYLAADPALRAAVAELESLLELITRGRYTIAECDPFVPDAGRVAPLVGIAGHIAMLLAIRSNRRADAHAELRGWSVHASRIECAREATVRRHAGSARPRSPDGMTGFVQAPDPLSIKCAICGANVGVYCGGAASSCAGSEPAQKEIIGHEDGGA